MKENINYRGFVMVDASCRVDSEQAQFTSDIGQLKPVVRRNPNDRGAWCLDCEKLGIYNENVYAACTVDSWKRAIDIAIMVLHREVRKMYDETGSMVSDTADLSETEKDKAKADKKGRFILYRHGEKGEAPCYAVKFDRYQLQVYQGDNNYGDKEPWFMVCNDVGISRGYEIGRCVDSDSAIKAAISIVKNKIDNMHTIACSLKL